MSLPALPLVSYNAGRKKLGLNHEGYCQGQFPNQIAYPAADSATNGASILADYWASRATAKNPSGD